MLGYKTNNSENLLKTWGGTLLECGSIFMSVWYNKGVAALYPWGSLWCYPGVAAVYLPWYSRVTAWLLCRNRSYFCIVSVKYRYYIMGHKNLVCWKNPSLRIKARSHECRMVNTWETNDVSQLKNKWHWQRWKKPRTNNAHCLMMSVHSKDRTGIKQISMDAKNWHSFLIRRLMRHSCDRAFKQRCIIDSKYNHAEECNTYLDGRGLNPFTIMLHGAEAILVPISVHALEYRDMIYQHDSWFGILLLRHAAT